MVAKHPAKVFWVVAIIFLIFWLVYSIVWYILPYIVLLVCSGGY